MRKTLRIAPACVEHVEHLAGKLRPQDYDEALAASGMDPYAALQSSYTRSTLVWAALVQDRAVALFGVGPGGARGVGFPWLLGTRALETAARSFVTYSREYIRRMRQQYPVLMNMVDARNLLSVRWLRWCGFSVEAPGPFGPFGLPFHLFHMGV